MASFVRLLVEPLSASNAPLLREPLRLTHTYTTTATAAPIQEEAKEILELTAQDIRNFPLSSFLGQDIRG